MRAIHGVFLNVEGITTFSFLCVFALLNTLQENEYKSIYSHFFFVIDTIQLH